MGIFLRFEYFGRSKLRQVPSDTSAFAARNASSNIMMQCFFDGKSPDMKLMTQRAREILKNMKTIALNDVEETAAYGNYEYGPYMHPPETFTLLIYSITVVKDVEGHLNTSANVFGDNYPRLQEIKAMYDPNCLFSRWFGITPKAQA
jgi:hypothetical protein